MNYKRFALTTIVIALFAFIWNAAVHLVILREADAIVNLVGRSESDRNLLLSLFQTIILSLVFVWSYARCARRGTVREGLLHGLFFGILAGILVDLNQYILYPIPASLAACWFAFGLIEFCIYGILASRLYPLNNKEQ